MSLKTYAGNCHCGAYRFQIRHPEITSASLCDCSYCAKAGWAYIRPQEFEVTRDGGLKEYRFGSKEVSFQFCGTCGTAVKVLVGDRISINARTISGLDIWKLDMNWQNGKDIRTTNESPLPMSHSLVPKDDEKVYTGACHCGAVKIAVRTKPLPQVLVKECNCSICIRHALILFYPRNGPDIEREIELSGEENLTTYSWARKFAGHRFCKICGIEVDAEMYGPPKESLEKLDETRLQRYREFMKMHPVNLRILDNVEWAGEVGEFLEVDGKVKVTREDGTQDGQPYELDP